MEKVGLEKLKEVKWAFNAKPDILLVSRSNVLLFEAKLESVEGKKKNGYQQYPTLERISSLWEFLIPSSAEKVFTL